MDPGIHYLFIDGDYFQKACSEVMEPIFGIDPEIDFEGMCRDLNCQKAFYYGCIDDNRHAGEDEPRYRERVEAEEQKYETIQSQRGFHVRLGTLAGSKPKRLRQKEVDVQLAVDMLSHAFLKNMSSAVLVTGDLDFRPVVRSLVQFGAYVRLCYLSTSIAKDLLWASDEGIALDVDRVYRWTKTEFRAQHPLPNIASLAVPPETAFATKRAFLQRNGMLRNFIVQEWHTESDNRYHLVIHREKDFLCFSNRGSEYSKRSVKAVWTNAAIPGDR